MPVRLGVWPAAALPAALAASVALMLVAGAAAQSPSPPPPPAAAPPQPKPVTGFVPTFEIMRTVRAAGFDPLAPPLREGTTYVLRAADYRGILMRVVLDARTGAIRDVTRIVPAASGSLGVILPPYGPPPYEAPYLGVPYGAPVEYEVSPPGSQRAGEAAAPHLPQHMAAPLATRAKASIRLPPLPRPRPPGLPQSPAAPAKTEKGAPASGTGAAAASEKTEKTKAIGSANPVIAQPAPSPPAAQAKSPAPIPLND